MERKKAKTFHIVFSAILTFASPFLFMASIFALAGAGNSISMGKFDNLGMVIIGYLPVYFVLVNLWGWFVIIKNKPHDYKVFLYPSLVTLILMIWFVFSI